MTIEKLLECSASSLSALSDEDLRKHFEPYLNVTRPEHPDAPLKGTSQTMTGSPKVNTALKNMTNENKDLLKALMAASGIDSKKLGIK